MSPLLCHGARPVLNNDERMAGNPKTRRDADGPAAGTRRREFWCACPEGHRFAAALFAAVDLDEQPEALEPLSDAGMQPARCPQCGAGMWLAEAFVIHQASRSRSALFVPDAVSHRELELRAEALRSLAASASTAALPHTADPVVVVGIAALQRWLFGEQAAAAGRAASTSPPPREIHAAFKDLEDPERPSNRPSLPPPGPQMDGVDVNEPLLDEDWLADEAIAPARHKAGGAQGKRGERSQGETSIARPGRRRSSGVDFAGLLADDDSEPPAERGVAKRRSGRDDG